MRVIFAGQTGVEKKKVLEALRKEIEAREPCKKVGVYHVDDEIRTVTQDWFGWLDTFNHRVQQDQWRQAFRNILDRIEKEDKPHYVLLSDHLVCWRFGRIFHPWDLDLFREFKPTVFVTLIDDMYSIWKRVKNAEEGAQSGSYFRLREIASWRMAEMAWAEHLSKVLIPESKDGEKHFFVSIKHPPLMLYRLLLRPEILRLYASFPISRTRFDPEKRKEIDTYRAKLHEYFTVFDPLTIDEKVLQFVAAECIYYEKNKDVDLDQLAKRFELETTSLESYLRKVANTDKGVKESRISKDGIVIFKQSDRWAITPEFKELLPLQGDSNLYDEKGRIPLVASEVQEVADDINRQVEQRDFRLIDKAHRVAVYRPQYEGGSPHGVSSELVYANTIGKRVLGVSFPKVDGELLPPFNMINNPRNSIDKLIDDLIADESKTFGTEPRRQENG